MNQKRFHVLYAVLALVGVMFAHDLWVGYRQVAVLPYSQFQALVREKKVAEVQVGEDRLQGTLKEPLDGKTRFVTNRVGPELAKELDDAQVKYSGTAENRLVEMLLSWLLPVLLFFGVWLFLARKMAGRLGPGGGLMAIGKSKAKVFVETDVQVRFGDVAGVDEAKGELQEVVNYLKDPDSYGRLGGRLPKGILLVGPPGTGKTLLAKAVAGEAHVPFFSISGSEFVEMFVGVGAARVRDLFEQARAKAPAIIFIDELDALGRARGANLGLGGHDEKEQTLNQLLVEMDGFDTRSGLVLLAATNRPDVLDPALLRAGRFDRQVLVDRPDRSGRTAILQVHVSKVKLAPEVKLEDVAAITAGFSGADLANLVNEAALAATRRSAEAVERVDFDVAVERIVAGLEKKTRLLNGREREFVAFHEMGHALVAAASTGADPVHKVSIIPRGLGALGYTLQRPTEDRFLMTRGELEGRLCVLLGGRAAEALVFQHTSTGAADDLSRATDIARDMATRFAMVPALGPVSYETEPSGFLGPQPGQRRNYSEQTAREIDVAVRDIVSDAFARAEAVLKVRRQTLERAARLLLERETLVDSDLKELFAQAQAEAARTPRAA
jgi:cell division protease FtsH